MNLGVLLPGNFPGRQGAAESSAWLPRHTDNPLLPPNLVLDPVSRLFSLKFPGEERIMWGQGNPLGERLLITAALEPKTGFLWNIQCVSKAPPTSRPPPSPRPAPPKLQSGNTDNNEIGQKNSGISEMFCLEYRMDELGRNHQEGPISPHPRQSRGTEVRTSLRDEGNQGM